MVTQLSATQNRLVDRVIEFGIGGAIYLPSILLHGPSGIGKRTIARASAMSLGLGFIEIPLSDAAEHVQTRLVQVFDKGYSTLVYFSGLEGMDSKLYQQVYALASSRSYTDTLGRERKIHDDVWIIASLAYPSRGYNLSLEHWLCTAFLRRVNIPTPSPEDLALIIKNYLF